ncbi:lytic transglycosylase domain-containing protein [Sphingorhabdus sp.]|uniref:lytic transglycosylase domain-containing protein n=1 Tax=Sphingorhabdus sp. TaxID=1902408 RepID=UPI0032B7FB7A
MDQASPISSISTPVWRAIESASRRTGVDFEYLLDQARIESGFRPDARAATSSASGLFQFTTQTWLTTLKRHGAEHGFGWATEAIAPVGKGSYRIADPSLRNAILDLRNDPEAAAVMAGELASDNRAHLADALGRAPEPVDLYLAHFLGSAGASDFLKAWAANPDQPAATLFAKAAAANRPVFFDASGSPRSLDAIRRSFAAKLSADVGLNPRPEMATHRSAIASTMPNWTSLEMGAIEPMPKRLSLDFARDAYRKLSGARGAAA